MYKGGVIGTTLGKGVMVSGIDLELVSIKERGPEEGKSFYFKIIYSEHTFNVHECVNTGKHT